jgi:hypothetical protein
MSAETGFEIRLANGELETAESLWAARHAVARHVAFTRDPTNPREILPAAIWKTGPRLCGGRVFVEEIRAAAELSTTN